MPSSHLILCLPVQCRFSSIPGPSPLGARNAPSAKCDNQKCLWMLPHVPCEVESPLVENYWYWETRKSENYQFPNGIMIRNALKGLWSAVKLHLNKDVTRNDGRQSLRAETSVVTNIFTASSNEHQMLSKQVLCINSFSYPGNSKESVLLLLYPPYS